MGLTFGMRISRKKTCSIELGKMSIGSMSATKIQNYFFVTYVKK